jgi:hypothetical protein
VSEESTLFDEKSNRNQTRGNLGAISGAIWGNFIWIIDYYFISLPAELNIYLYGKF